MTAWTKFATAHYKKRKAEVGPSYKFKDALKEAGKLYKKGSHSAEEGTSSRSSSSRSSSSRSRSSSSRTKKARKSRKSRRRRGTMKRGGKNTPMHEEDSLSGNVPK